MYDFDKVIERSETNSVKYDLREFFFQDKDVIPMWVADMDFETPEFIRDAIKKRAEHPIYGYSIKPESYFQSIINWLKKRFTWDIEKKDILFSPGVVPGFTLAIMAYTQPGDKVVTQPPVYFPFFQSVEDNGRELVYNQLIEKDNYYTIDFEDLDTKLSDPKAKVLLISSPHNPVGRVWHSEELEKMVTLCHKHDVLILTDEIHSDLVFKGSQHIPTASISNTAKELCVTFMAPSKTFNMAGLSTSFLVIQNEKLKKKYEEILQAYHLGMGNVFGNEALEAAYNFGEDWLEELNEYLSSNTNFVFNFLEKNIPEITFLKPEATYLLWLNCKELGLNEKELPAFFIKKAGLGLNNGTIFGPGGNGYMRMNVACPLSTIKIALGQLLQAIEQLRKDKR
ncbi:MULTISPECIES: MalY/PatB family protein [unclassified Lentimicrobium]|uniref:MalY/PatB family protein n=1 Tax=unclassified Lentimicrobium TaxID=2677434 RepID=UPI00155799BB|nr:MULTISPECIES: PatB family C-S lyase [unclassified Lentimicrobium]NPD44787.1 putative C-S lyase [Lentimicrobium sp. S6]NPD83196.1 putative C-S lyase [Lentimicrobium sp. L6]